MKHFLIHDTMQRIILSPTLDSHQFSPIISSQLSAKSVYSRIYYVHLFQYKHISLQSTYTETSLSLVDKVLCNNVKTCLPVECFLIPVLYDRLHLNETPD